MKLHVNCVSKMLRHDELTIISPSKDLFREAHKFFVWENCVFISKVEL